MLQPGKKVLVVSERFTFGSRVQNFVESIDDLVVALRRLARTCEFELFSCFSARIVRIRDRILQGNLAREECFEIAQRIEPGITTSALLKIFRLGDLSLSVNTAQRLNLICAVQTRKTP